MQIPIHINKEYAIKEKVFGWICSYAKRNSIKIKIVGLMYGGDCGELIDYIRLVFKSQRQIECFKNRGNSNHPYFEFL